MFARAGTDDTDDAFRLNSKRELRIVPDPRRTLFHSEFRGFS